jgi:hypothetical protein
VTVEGEARPAGRQRLHTLLVFAVALLARAAVVAWAWGEIPPIADGTYYDILGRRIAEGSGYTWLWPDGVVTFAAHYPVGYPALVALSYLVFGPDPSSAMIANALVGALGAGALHRALLGATSPRAALALALLGFALHPALLSYTPALMTEGVSASFVAAALAATRALGAGSRRARWLGVLCLGVVVGLGALVRPQLLVLAPALAAVAAWARERSPVPEAPRVRRWGKVVVVAALALLAALAVIAPWTARNCDKMGRCALVSLNGGWNLLIGTNPRAGGTWAPVEVPAACTEVFDEAEKDACLGREGVSAIRRDPATWLALAPKKLAATFNHVGAGPWYLHDANPVRFSERARTAAALLEELAQRLLYAAALGAIVLGLTRARLSSPRGRWGAVGAAALVGLAAPGWITVLVASALALLGGFSARERGAPLLAAGVVLGATAATHVVFFGAGRYSLVIIPALVLATATARGPWARQGF